MKCITQQPSCNCTIIQIDHENMFCDLMTVSCTGKLQHFIPVILLFFKQSDARFAVLHTFIRITTTWLTCYMKSIEICI